MARQTYKYSPVKQFFAYTDFSGGMNVVDAEESLSENEWRLLQNVELEQGGGASRRTGFNTLIELPESSSSAQGYFRYYATDGSVHHFIARGGILRRVIESNGVFGSVTRPSVGVYNESTGTFTSNATWSFQTTRSIEAVQYGEIMIIATGTKLLEYNGTALTTMKPYKPTATEVVKIGVNMLSEDPNNYVIGGSGAVLVNEGIIAERRKGIISKAVTMTAIYSKPSAMNVQIKWEYKRAGDATWTVGRDFSTTTTYNFTPSEIGMWDIRTTIRETNNQDTTTYRIYVLTNYEVTMNEDERHHEDMTTIQTCNRVMLYYEQLILYGDATNANAVYFSDVYRPNYVPVFNSLTFSDIKFAKITAIVKFYGMLVVFTEDNIWSLSGTNPYNFEKKSINSSIGCIAPFSARAVANYVFFLSREGVYKLKAIYNNDNRLNVESVDNKIKPLIAIDADASAIQYNNQYHLMIPSLNKRFRYYHLDKKCWVVDESPKMSFDRMYTHEGELYAQTTVNGNVVLFSDDVFTDDGEVYKVIWESKGIDCGLPYHKKKPKEMFFSFKHDPNEDINLKVYIYLDDSAIITPEEYKVSIVDNLVYYTLSYTKEDGQLVLPSSTSFGVWVLGASELGTQEGTKHVVRLRGSGHKLRFKIIQEEDNSTGLLGFGLTTKISKPTAS